MDELYEIKSQNRQQWYLAVRNKVLSILDEELQKLDDARWLKTLYTQPCFDDFTFSYKNQVFSILIDIRDSDTGESWLSKDQKTNFTRECNEYNLIPCLFPVVAFQSDDKYTFGPLRKGWNLKHFVTGATIEPEKMVTSEKIPMSVWELHTFAIDIVRFHISNELRCQMLNYQTLPLIDPQLWFVDKDGMRKFVVVRHTMYPEEMALKPEHINSINAQFPDDGGYFASVSFRSKGENPSVLYREEKFNYLFRGLQQIKFKHLYPLE